VLEFLKILLFIIIYLKLIKNFIIYYYLVKSHSQMNLEFMRVVVPYLVKYHLQIYDQLIWVLLFLISQNIVRKLEF